jgi:hypothetical protein
MCHQASAQPSAEQIPVRGNTLLKHILQTEDSKIRPLYRAAWQDVAYQV